MPAQTDTRGEVLRCAREAAHVVLAKHPRVTLGGVWVRGVEAVVIDLRPEGARRRIGHEGEDPGSGQNAAGAGGSK